MKFNKILDLEREKAKKGLEEAAIKKDGLTNMARIARTTNVTKF